MSTRFSEAVRAVDERLTYHAATGRSLAGWKVVRIPRTETEPIDSLPSVRIQAIAIDEGNTMPRSVTSAAITIALEVAVKRSDGLAELADGVARVMDAIETDPVESDGFDLKASTMNGMTGKAEGSGVTGIALFTHIAVVVGTKPYHRGNRRGA